jgi:two-component system, LytTR family, sensor kinase
LQTVTALPRLDALPSPWIHRWFWHAQIAGWALYLIGAFVNDAAFNRFPLAGPMATLPFRIIGCLLAFAISSCLAILLHRLPETRDRPKAVVTAVALGAIVAGSLRIPLFAVASAPFRTNGLPACPLPDGLLPVLLINWWIMLIWSVLFLAVRDLRLVYGREKRALQSERLASEARYQMLVYQVNPHFLFNALNSVRALVASDIGRAREMITRLSAFLRHTLVTRPSGTVPLREEIATLDAYLAIEQVRHEEALQVEFDVSPDVADLRVPGFVVHPLVENAITHGFDAPNTRLRIAIRARRTADDLIIEVVNSGTLRNRRANGTGIGLENVRERLAHLHPGRASMTLTEEACGVVARVTLPLAHRNGTS